MVFFSILFTVPLIPIPVQIPPKCAKESESRFLGIGIVPPLVMSHLSGVDAAALVIPEKVGKKVVCFLPARACPSDSLERKGKSIQ